MYLFLKAKALLKAITNSSLSIRNPTIDEIFQYGESEYFSLVRSLTATPADMKSTLFDIGIDYEEISELEVFFLLCNRLTPIETSILFGDNVNFSSFNMFINNLNGENILCETDNNVPKQNGCVIDSYLHMIITNYLRDMHGFLKNTERAGNEYTKQILIDEDRRLIEQSKKKEYESMLYPMILAGVNCAEFKYDFDSVWNLPISVFIKGIQQIGRYKNIEYTMQGIYSGCIDGTKINNKDLSWFFYEKK